MQLSSSHIAEQVRTYYIQLEKLIDQYKNHIIYSMEQKIKQLETNQKPKINYKSGVIYVFKSDKNIEDLYRIGKTQNLKHRMKNHNSSHPNDIELIFVLETPNIDKVEKCLKIMLKEKQYRRTKEFFQVDIDIIKEVIHKCDDVALVAKMKPKKFKQMGGYYIILKKHNN